MFYFIYKFNILIKFIQNINDVRNEVWFNISHGIMYIYFPIFRDFYSSDMGFLSKCTIKIPGNTGSRGDPMASPSFCG